ncbi:hypothetical protein VWR87_001347 [Campylobacter jejuni]|nr:hypothetical protein [Campylobacter jejuni]
MNLKDFDFRIWGGKKYINNIKGGVYIHKINDYIKCLKRNQDCYDYEFELDDLDNSNLEIELFTGLYDRKWNKIYEGDIVCKEGENIGFVKYHQGMFKVVEKEDFMIPLGAMFMRKYIEIIGNIHENAELLKLRSKKMTEMQFNEIKERLSKWCEERHLTYENQQVGF